MSTQTTYDSAVNSIYLAFYGRPADPAGLTYWSAQLAAAKGDMSSIIDAFATSDEASTRFGDETVTQRVTDMYQQLFNRAPDATGLAYWSAAVAGGQVGLATVAVAMLNGAQGTDHTLVDLRQQAMDSFTAQVAAAGTAYSGYAAITAASVLVRAVTLDSSAADIDALVKAVVSFADTATKTPAVVDAIATGSTLAALYDTTRGSADPVGLTQTLADTAKAAAGNPDTLDSLLRGGGMAQVLKVMPADASLTDVVQALASGGLAAAIEVVYPTATAPVSPFSLHLAFAGVSEGALDLQAHDNVTNVASADIQFHYTGANLTSGQHFEYSLDGSNWITTGIDVSTATKTVTLEDVNLAHSPTLVPTGLQGVHIMSIEPVSNVTSTVYLRAADASGAHTTALVQPIVYDAQAPLIDVNFAYVDQSTQEAPAQTGLASAKVFFDYNGTLAAGETFQYSLDNGAWTTLGSSALDTSTQTLTIPAIDFSTADHTVNVRAIDAAGNVTETVSQLVDSTANDPVPAEMSTLTSVHSTITAGSTDASVLTLVTSGYDIVTATGTGSADGFANKADVYLFSASDVENLGPTMPVNVIDDAHLVGNQLTFDSPLEFDVYQMMWQSDAFLTAGPSGHGYVAPSPTILVGGSDGNLTVAVHSIDITTAMPTAGSANVSNDDTTSRIYSSYSDVDVSIHTGGGMDYVVGHGTYGNNIGDASLTLVYDSFAAIAPDLVIGFATGQDVIEIDGAAALKVDANNDGVLQWATAAADTPYTFAPGIEAVEIDTDGAIVIGNGANDAATTMATLNAALNVASLPAATGVLVLANGANHSVLFYVDDSNGNGTIDSGEYDIVAVVGQSIVHQADVQLVGSVIIPD